MCLPCLRKLRRILTRVIDLADEWVPRTRLGKMVVDGEIKSLEEIWEKGYVIKEPEIIDILLPDLNKEIIYIGGSPGKGGGIQRRPTRRTARMHRSGRRFKVSAMVIVGDGNGHIGLGFAKANDNNEAIEKATKNAKLNIIPVKRGCGSWECTCGKEHSLAFNTSGKSGSVRVELRAAPRGLGLCMPDEMKKIFRLVGIEDLWLNAYGNTGARVNFVRAIFDAFKQMNKKREMKLQGV